MPEVMWSSTSPGITPEGDGGVAGLPERSGAVECAPEHRVEVETPEEARQAAAQHLELPLGFAGVVNGSPPVRRSHLPLPDSRA